MRVAVTGATGRMGRAVVETARERGVEVPLAVHHQGESETVAGVEVEPAAELETLLVERDVDALVDFTGPKSSLTYVAECAGAGVPAVVGTTGFDERGEGLLRERAEDIPVLRAANFARGVQALKNAVREAVRSLPGYDIELTETHHNAKRDAPSGTAKELLSVVEAELDDHAERPAAGRPEGPKDDRHVHGREGVAPRSEDEVGVHARRAGDITGEHELLLAAHHEVLTLTHRAESRGVFAAGALDAAAWLSDRDPGYYTFADVVGDT